MSPGTRMLSIIKQCAVLLILFPPYKLMIIGFPSTQKRLLTLFSHFNYFEIELPCDPPPFTPPTTSVGLAGVGQAKLTMRWPLSMAGAQRPVKD